MIKGTKAHHSKDEENDSENLLEEDDGELENPELLDKELEVDEVSDDSEEEESPY